MESIESSHTYQNIGGSTHADSKSVLHNVRALTSSRHPDDKSMSGFEQRSGIPSQMPASELKRQYSAQGLDGLSLMGGFGLNPGNTSYNNHNSTNQLPGAQLTRPDSSMWRQEKAVRVKTANAVGQIVRDRYTADKHMLLQEFNERTKEQKSLQN
jgi:hypothetical protein